MTQSQTIMSHHYTQLSSTERGKIEAWRTPQRRSDGTTKPLPSISEIARRLGRNKLLSAVKLNVVLPLRLRVITNGSLSI